MSRKRGTKTVVVAGSQLLAFVVPLSTQSVSFALSPATFTRTNSLQGSFEFYRFTRLKCELLPTWISGSASELGMSSNCGVLGYLPEELTATSTTISASTVSQLDPCIAHTVGFYTSGSTDMMPGSTVHKVMNVPRRRLLSTPVKMYVCAASTEDTLVQQGTLVYAMDSANGTTEAVQAFVLCHYTCEFMVPTDSSLTLTKPLREDDDSKEATDQSMVVVEVLRPPLKPPAARRA